MKIFSKLFVFLGVFLFSSSLIASPLVDVDWLNDKISSGETENKILLIDLRNGIGNGSYETYLEGHIPTSIHSDYGKDGWRVAVDGTVGLVPSENQFQELARSLGVNSDTHIILIPAGVSSSDFGSAARSYWTFKAFGHDEVSVLNGGYAAWVANYPNDIEFGPFKARELGNFNATFHEDIYISTEQVFDIVQNNQSVILLDGRNEPQYYAEKKHPKSRVPGRLPGSELLFQENSYNLADNSLKDADELKDIYADYLTGEVVSYCNTGHWAATNWFVLSEILGNNEVRLYDGSMVEWTANEDLPIENSGPTNLDKLIKIIG
tara:strand:+ start:13478 stop:14440 length:963 start_codon:yes stop_codon:yes gene_type:complete